MSRFFKLKQLALAFYWGYSNHAQLLNFDEARIEMSLFLNEITTEIIVISESVEKKSE